MAYLEAGEVEGERVIIVWINGRPRPRRVCPGNGCLSRLGPGECDWRKVDARRETHCSLTLSTLIFAVDPYHGSYFDHGRGGRGQRKDGAGRHNGRVPRVEE